MPDLNAVTTWLEVAGVVLLAVCAALVAWSLVGGLLGAGVGAGAAGITCWLASAILTAIGKRVAAESGEVDPT